MCIRDRCIWWAQKNDDRVSVKKHSLLLRRQAFLVVKLPANQPENRQIYCVSIAYLLYKEKAKGQRCILYTSAPEIALDVPACFFTPPPKVDSAFVTMRRRERPKVDVVDEGLLFKVASAAFAMRRKTMANNLIAAFRISRDTAADWLAACGISESARGETLAAGLGRPQQCLA